MVSFCTTVGPLHSRHLADKGIESGCCRDVVVTWKQSY